MKLSSILLLPGYRLLTCLSGSLIVIFICSISAFTIGQSEKTDFSGSWSLNDGKSNFGDSQFRRAALKITIEQKDNDMTLEKMMTVRSGQTFNFEEKLTLDGKECENSVNNRVRKSRANWTEDGKSLTISTMMVFEREGQSIEINTVEIYKKSDDGNNLIIDYTSSSPRGEMKETLVYDGG